MNSKGRKLILCSLFLILLISLSIGSISAADGESDDLSALDGLDVISADSDFDDLKNSNQDIETLENYGQDLTTQISDDNSSELSQEDENKVLGVKVSQSDYSTYFDASKNGTIKVSAGSQIDLTGAFSNKYFTINKNNIVITSTSGATFTNCVFRFIAGSEGSTLSNLRIDNSANTEGEHYAIYLYNTKNIKILNNVVSSAGYRSFPIRADLTNSSIIQGNDLTSIKTPSQSSSPSNIVVTNSFYNNITDNNITCDDNNGIYLWNGNVGYTYIFNNTIHSTRALPSSFCYAIQLQAYNTTVKNNTVYNMYRGFSSVGANNSAVGNIFYNMHGAFLSTAANEQGADPAIIAGKGSIVRENIIYDSNFKEAAISISGNNVEISDNRIENNTGGGINLIGSFTNILISGNDIKAPGIGINLEDGVSFVNISSNNITSTNDIGIKLTKKSSNGYPKNINITNNDIIVNEIAIDASGALDIDSLYINDNEVYGKIINYTRGIAAIYYIDEDNFYDYFNNDGSLSGRIADGSILYFIDDFTSKGALKISSKVTINGRDARLFNTSFIIQESDVVINNLFINNSNKDATDKWGVHASNINNLTVNNTQIYMDDEFSSFAILFYNVTNSKITNNILEAKGDYLTSPILIFHSSNNTISGNKMISIGTNGTHNDVFIGRFNVLFDGSQSYDETYMAYGMYKTYGAFIVYSSLNNITNNDIHVNSTLVEPITYDETVDPIAGLFLHCNCSNNIVSFNNISVSGNDPYVYGIGILGANEGRNEFTSENNELSGNIIDVKSNYLARGIVLGFNADNNYFSLNQIDVNGSNYSYWISFDQFKDNSVYQNNGSSYSLHNAYESNMSISLSDEYKLNDIDVFTLIVDVNASDDNTIAIQTAIDNAKDGQIIYLSNANFTDLADINITKSLTFAGGSDAYIRSASNAESIFNIISLSNGGPVSVKFENLTVIFTSDNTNFAYIETCEDDEGFSDIPSILIENNNFAVDEGVDASSIAVLKIKSDSSLFNPANPISINGNTLSEGMISYACGDASQAGDVETAPNKALSSINIDSSQIEQGKIIISLLGANNVPIKNSNVTYDLNGVRNTIVTDGNGQAIISGLKGYYVISFSFEGDKLHNSSSNSLTHMVVTKFSYSNISIKAYPSDGYFKFTLLDSYGGKLANKKVVIKFNGGTYTKYTDKNGLVSFYVNPKKTGKLSIAVSFAGDSAYKASSFTAYVTVGKNAVKFQSPTKKVKKSKSKRTFKITLKTATGKVLTSKKLYIKINGKTYSSKTNSKGVARFKIKLPKKKKTYKYKVTFKGDSLDTKKTYSGKLKVY